MRHIIFFISVFIAIFCGKSHAQDTISWLTEMNIYGESFSCTSSNGNLARLAWSEEANKWAGGLAVQGELPSIMLSPTYVKNIPKLSAYFLFLHECGHVALPSGIGSNSPDSETNADCFAAKEMRKAGLITSWKEFNDALAFTYTLPGSGSTHLPGPERVLAAAKCVKLPIMKSDYRTCKTIDSIFSKGKHFIASISNEKLFNGLGCTTSDEGALIYCRDGSIEISKKEVKRRLIELDTEIRNCLPAEFTLKGKIFNDDTEFPDDEYTLNTYKSFSGAEVLIGARFGGEILLDFKVPK